MREDREILNGGDYAGNQEKTEKEKDKLNTLWRSTVFTRRCLY